MAKPKLKDANTSPVVAAPVAPAPEASTDTGTEGTEEGAEADETKEDSKTLAGLRAEFNQNRNIVLRKVNFVYARKLLEKPNMTWEEFCDVKKEVFSEHWEAKKTNPNANRIMRALSPKRIEKKKEAREKLLAKLAEMNKQLDLSGVPVQ